VEGQHKPRTTGSATFASLRLNVDWRKIAPKYVKKALISKQTLGHFKKLELADTFE